MITVTFYPLDTERYGRVFVREFPDTATWKRVRASLTGTYHSIEVSYPPDGSNYHDHLCRCPGCDPQPPDDLLHTDESPYCDDSTCWCHLCEQEIPFTLAEMEEIMNEPSPLDEDYHRTFFDGLGLGDLEDHPF